MRGRDLAALLALSAVWGGSFIFIRIAAPLLGPVALMALRVAIAGSLLWIIGRLSGRLPKLDARWPHILVVGVMNSAVPFTLIATAELHISASLAATLNATTPLFGALLAAIALKEALTLPRVAGLLLGFAGVAVLVGMGPVEPTGTVLVAIAMSLAGALCYGGSAVYTRLKLGGTSSFAITTYSLLFATLALAPLVPFNPPPRAPGSLAIASLLVLAVLCTAAANLLYYRLIASIGMKATMVTYLSPAFGMLWGGLFLHEAIGMGSLAGFAMILASVVLISRKGAPAAAPAVARPA